MKRVIKLDKYHIVTVKGTHPVSYTVQRLYLTTHTRWRHDPVVTEAWVTERRSSSWREYTFWHDENFACISEAEKYITDKRARTANKGGEVVKEL